LQVVTSWNDGDPGKLGVGIGSPADFAVNQLSRISLAGFAGSNLSECLLRQDERVLLHQSPVAIVAITLGVLLARASGAGPYLINAQQSDFRNRPEYIRDHLAYIETLPFDGLTFSTTTGSAIMSGGARSYAAIASDFAPLNGLTFTRMRHNFVLVNVDRPADFFSDWGGDDRELPDAGEGLERKRNRGNFFRQRGVSATAFQLP
jgi:hypothetical protein